MSYSLKCKTCANGEPLSFAMGDTERYNCDQCGLAVTVHFVGGHIASYEEHPEEQRQWTALGVFSMRDKECYMNNRSWFVATPIRLIPKDSTVTQDALCAEILQGLITKGIFHVENNINVINQYYGEERLVKIIKFGSPLYEEFYRAEAFLTKEPTYFTAQQYQSIPR